MILAGILPKKKTTRRPTDPAPAETNLEPPDVPGPRHGTGAEAASSEDPAQES